MMCPDMVLALIISKIFLNQVPLDITSILCNFISDPKLPHHHQAQSLVLDCMICNANSSCVIAVDVHFGLWVTKFFKR
jgi:hypothetical protein